MRKSVHLERGDAEKLERPLHALFAEPFNLKLIGFPFVLGLTGCLDFVQVLKAMNELVQECAAGAQIAQVPACIGVVLVDIDQANSDTASTDRKPSINAW